MRNGLISIIVVAFYIPRDKAKMFQLLHTITICSDQSEACEADTECSFVLHFSNKWFLNTFSSAYRHLHIFSRKRKVIQVLCLSLSCLVFSLLHSLWVVYVPWACPEPMTSTEWYPTEESEKTRRDWKDGSVKHLHSVHAHPSGSNSQHLWESQARKCEPVNFRAGRWNLLARQFSQISEIQAHYETI